MTSQRSDLLAAAADEIGARVRAIYDELGPVAARASDLLEAFAVPGKRIGPLPRPLVLDLRDLTDRMLARRANWLGSGVIFSVNRIVPGTRLIEWSMRNVRGEIAPVMFEHAPDAFNYYEFERLPWFAIARETGGPGFAGPYIDWTGVDDYIVTFTVPISLHEEFSGVLGCDISVTNVERIVLPLLRAVPGDAALVNPEGRVIVGNSARFVAGDVIRVVPDGADVEGIRAPAAGLRLVAVDRD